jgi:hypothetical protein
MSIPWNHTVSIHRDVPVRGAMGSTSSWALVYTPTAPNAFADMTVQGTTHDAGGERGATNRRWFLSPAFRPTMGDVLVISAGPEAPARVRVRTVTAAARPGGTTHHYEVMTEQYDGAAP